MPTNKKKRGKKKAKNAAVDNKAKRKKIAAKAMLTAVGSLRGSGIPYNKLTAIEHITREILLETYGPEWKSTPKGKFEAEKDAIEALAAYTAEYKTPEKIAEEYPNLPHDANNWSSETMCKWLVGDLAAEMLREKRAATVKAKRCKIAANALIATIDHFDKNKIPPNQIPMVEMMTQEIILETYGEEWFMNPKEFFEAEKDAIEALAEFTVKKSSLEEIAGIFPHLSLDNCSPETILEMLIDDLKAEMKRRRRRERAKEKDKDENVRTETLDIEYACYKVADNMNIAELDIFRDVLSTFSDSTNPSVETMGKLLFDAFGEERGCEILREMLHDSVPNEKINELLVNAPGTEAEKAPVEIETRGNASIETLDTSTTFKLNEAEIGVFVKSFLKHEAGNLSSEILSEMLVDACGAERAEEIFAHQGEWSSAIAHLVASGAEQTKVKSPSSETIDPSTTKIVLDAFSTLMSNKAKAKIFRETMSKLQAENTSTPCSMDTLNKVLIDTFGLERSCELYRVLTDHDVPPEAFCKVIVDSLENGTEEKEAVNGSAEEAKIVHTVDKGPIKEVDNASAKEICKMLLENFADENIPSFSSHPPVRFTCRRYVHHKSSMMWTICFDYFGVDTTRNKTMIIQEPITNLSLRNEVEVWLRVERETTKSHNTTVTIFQHESVASAVAFFKDEITSIKSDGYLYKESHRVGVVPRKSRISIARATISEAVSTKDGQNAESKTTSVSSVAIEDESDVLANKVRRMCVTPWMHAEIEANGDYKKFTDEWMDLDMLFFVGGDHQEQIAKIRGFYLRNAKLMGDEKLAQFIFSYATCYYLGKEIYKRGEAPIDQGVISVEEYQQRRVKYLIRLGQIIKQVHQVEVNSESCVQLLSGEFLFDAIMLNKDLSKYHDDSNLEVPKKLAKFFVQDLDLDTNRGLITYLAKLDPTGSIKKIKALNSGLLPKIGTCYACDKTFPRNDLYVCACSTVQYCSKKCQINDWAKHGRECKSFRGLVQQVRSVIPDNTALLELVDEGKVNLQMLHTDMGCK